MSSPAENTPQKLQSIEAARGVAALSVVLMHAANLMNVPHFSGHIGLGGIFNFGYVGVDFFFVLSGFIISYVHFNDLGRPDRIGLYLWRRFSRIFPIFWVCLVLAIVVMMAGRLVLGKSKPLGLEWIDLLGTVLLVNVAEPKFLPVAWTLQYEVMFYATFTVLLLHKRLGMLLMALWAGAIVLGTVPSQHSNERFFLSSHSLQFIMGICVGVASRRGLGLRGPPWLLLGVACSAMVAATLMERWVVPEHSDAGRLLLGLASATTLLCLLAIESQGGVSIPRPLVALGSVSYSVYLAHIIFIPVIYSILLKLGLYQRLPEPVVFAIGAGGALALTVALGRLVELPLVARLKPVVGR